MKPNRILLGPSPCLARPPLQLYLVYDTIHRPSCSSSILSFIHLFTWRTIEQLRGSKISRIPSERTNQTRPDPHTAQDQHHPAMLTRKLSEPKAKSCPKPLPAPLQSMCVCRSPHSYTIIRTPCTACSLAKCVPLPCHWRKGC